MPKLLTTPDGHRNAFDIFSEFIAEMESQNCSGLEISKDGKIYKFSITDKEEEKRNTVGFRYNTNYDSND